MTEQQIQTKIIKYLTEKDAYVVKVERASKSGVPDLIVCYKGCFLGVEVKRPDKLHTVRPLQEHNLQLITKAGGYRCVATSIEEVEILLKRIDNGKLYSVQSRR